MSIEIKTVDITELPIAKGFQHFDMSAISKPIEVKFTWQPQPRLSVGNIVTIKGGQYRVTFAEYVGEALELQLEAVE